MLASNCSRWLIPASRLSGVRRNPSRALGVACGDGLQSLPTEPGRESPELAPIGDRAAGGSPFVTIPIMRREAEAQLRGKRLIVSSWSTTVGKFPAQVQDDWAEAADEPVPDDRIGSLARTALAASRDGVPYPDFRNDPEPARRRQALFKLAGVKSETAYAKGTKSFSISWDDTRPELRITPYRNEGRKRGFTQILDAVILVDADATDAALGAAIRQGLEAATE
jgi:hypothetical protein